MFSEIKYESYIQPFSVKWSAIALHLTSTAQRKYETSKTLRNSNCELRKALLVSAELWQSTKYS